MKLSPKTLAYITLLVCWGPSNILYYVWGYILFLFILCFKTEWLRLIGPYSKKIGAGALIFCLVFGISIFFNFNRQHSSLNNVMWSILTYGSSLTLLLSFLVMPFEKDDLKKLFKFSLYFTLFQVFLGYFQILQVTGFQHWNPLSAGGAGGSDGDFFVGTTFSPGIGGFVAIKLSLMVLLFIPEWFANKNIRNTSILLALLIGWVLASAIFTLIVGMFVVMWFFVAGKIFNSFFTFRLNKSVFYSMLGVMVIIATFIVTQPSNVSYILESANETYASITDKNVALPTLKVPYYKRTLNDLPKEFSSTYLLGVGPGNYSSRSAWLVSGEYLEDQPAYIPVTPTPVMQNYVLSLWTRKLISPDFPGAGSVLHQPFSTWLSVFAEMGLVALAGMFLIFRGFYQGAQKAKFVLSDAFTGYMSLGTKMCIVYICLLFFVENLFEYPLVMGQFFVFSCVLIRNTENKMQEIQIVNI